MTITLKPAAVLALVAIVGILIGLCVGQLANAQSERASASGAGSAQVVAQLKQINNKLGATYSSSTVLGILDDTRNAIGTSNYDSSSVLHNTYETCKAAKDSFSC